MGPRSRRGPNPYHVPAGPMACDQLSCTPATHPNPLVPILRSPTPYQLASPAGIGKSQGGWRVPSVLPWWPHSGDALSPVVGWGPTEAGGWAVTGRWGAGTGESPSQARPAKPGVCWGLGRSRFRLPPAELRDTKASCWGWCGGVEGGGRER